MLNSTSPEPYKTALTPEGLTFEEYKLLTNECMAVEEKYVEAVGVHKKAEEEWKVVEARKKEKERQVTLLKEQQDAADKKKKDDLRKKEKEEKEAAKKL
ncbi:hypothetical protein EV421DRAFT_1913102 [Armillaria borealis]|uniref:Uncharacterized protein n=1 Tax=Armillaria borealis TaxID=47425 RepID=A0AA39ITM9_9AGAR|nr:hypothetical protein EV421DRAFT_1913102 [Armillaria borealis]